MSTMVAPPEEATLEELESFTNRINRAFQELPRNTYATIAGQEVELTDMDSAIQSLVTTSKHDQLTGVEDSVKHALFLLLDGTRPMTGDLNMNLNDVYLGQAVAGANGALTGYASSGGGAPAIHKVEWMPHYQPVYGHGWRIYDRDYLAANPYGFMTIKDVAGTSVIYMGPRLYSPDLWATALTTNTIYERTATAGVTIDSMLVKDGHILLTALGGYVAQGDLIVGDAADWSILSNGTPGQILLTNGTDPGWTTTFTADMLFSGATKAYFEAVGTTPGTEFWTSGDNGFLDGWFDSGLRLYDSTSLILTIRGHPGAPARPQLYHATERIYIDSPTAVLLANSGTNIAYVSGLGLFVTVGNLFLKADNRYIEFGTGGDAHDYFDGANMIRYATGVTATAKHLFGLTGTETIVCGSLESSLGMIVGQTTISAAATLTAAHYIVLCDTDTAGAAFTVTLPAAADHTGRVYHIKNTGTGGFDVTVDGNGAETIDGNATQAVTDKNCLSIVSDATEWHIVS